MSEEMRKEEKQEIEEFNNIEELKVNKRQIMEIFFKRVEKMSEMIERLDLQR